VYFNSKKAISIEKQLVFINVLLINSSSFVAVDVLKMFFTVYGNNAMLLRKNLWKHDLLKENLANYTRNHNKPKVRQVL
jgi:hypothetical protein